MVIAIRDIGYEIAMVNNWVNRKDNRPRPSRRIRDKVLKRDKLCRCDGCYACDDSEADLSGDSDRPCARRSVIADHIIPYAEGGKDSMANERGMCNECHTLKSKDERIRGLQRYFGKRNEAHPGLINTPGG